MTLYPSDVINIANNIMGNRVYSAGMGGLVQQNYNNITDQAQGVEAAPVEYADVSIVVYNDFMGHSSIKIHDTEYNYGMYGDKNDQEKGFQSSSSGVSGDGDEEGDGCFAIAPNAYQNRIQAYRKAGTTVTVFGLRLSHNQANALLDIIEEEKSKVVYLFADDIKNVSHYKSPEISEFYTYHTTWRNCTHWAVYILRQVLTEQQKQVLGSPKVPSGMGAILASDWLGGKTLVLYMDYGK